VQLFLHTLIVSNGWDARGESRPNAIPESEPYTASSSGWLLPTIWAESDLGFDEDIFLSSRGKKKGGNRAARSDT